MEIGSTSPILRQARIPILSQDICEKATFNEYNADRLVCGGNYPSGGIDSCQVKSLMIDFCSRCAYHVVCYSEIRSFDFSKG